MAVIIPERLEAVSHIPLTVGKHDAPPPGEPPCEFCAEEKWAWITGLDWTDRPENKSPVISAFVRAYNDNADQAGRDAIDVWQLEHADQLVATVGDGQDTARGYLAADWAVHVAAPMWLELAGAADAAKQLRELAPIVDRDSAGTARAVAAPIRDRMWDERSRLLAPLREKVKAAVLKALEDKKAAVAAVAAGAAGAAEAAVAAEAAEAAGAAEDYWSVYDRVYTEVYNRIRDKFREVWIGKIKEKYGPEQASLNASAFELLERMVTVGHEG